MANKKTTYNSTPVETRDKKHVNKNELIKIISIIVASIFFIVCIGFVINSQAPANPKDYNVWCLSGFHGSFDKKGNPNEYWSVEKKQSGNDVLVTYAQLEITGSYSNVNELWVNFSDLYAKETEIEIINGTSRVIKTFTLTAKDLKKSKDGWFKIYDEDDVGKIDDVLAVTSRNFSIGISETLNVRELVFVKTDGEIIEYSVKGYKVATEVVSASDSRVTSDNNSVLNLNNEQSTFPYGHLPKNKD